MLSYSTIASALAERGLAARGGFNPASDDEHASHLVFPDGSGRQAKTVIMVGVEGQGLWPALMQDEDFEQISQTDRTHPLDRWSEVVIGKLALGWGAQAVFPNDQPYRPFQAWAQRADTVFPSPLGLLIHPDFGLWHAYRAALLFEASIELPQRAQATSPCESCTDRPCLSACPVSAFGEPAGDFANYDMPACAGYLKSDQGTDCLAGGCAARNACPVGVEHRYGPEQVRFHMRAFARARDVPEERFTELPPLSLPPLKISGKAT